MGLNSGYSYRERVGRAGGTTLDYFTRQHRHSTEQAWRARIESGQVELDGVRATPETLLKLGQELVWHRPGWEEPAVDTFIQGLFEDDVLLAVVKPRGLPTLPGGGFLENTLLSLVRARFPEASPMHRLGRETSGIVLFARTHAAAGLMQSAWRQNRVEKRYRALGRGLARQDLFEITVPIGPVPHPWLGTLHAANADGKPSRSCARVLQRQLAGAGSEDLPPLPPSQAPEHLGLGKGCTLFEVDIETGRPHQIRIHLAFAGHPLVGDPLYAVGGVPRTDITAVPGDGGYFLHAERLLFPHPITGHYLELWAPPPVELLMAGEQASRAELIPDTSR